jgi:hypothetical protein
MLYLPCSVLLLTFPATLTFLPRPPISTLMDHCSVLSRYHHQQGIISRKCSPETEGGSDTEPGSHVPLFEHCCSQWPWVRRCCHTHPSFRAASFFQRLHGGCSLSVMRVNLCNPVLPGSLLLLPSLLFPVFASCALVNCNACVPPTNQKCTMNSALLFCTLSMKQDWKLQSFWAKHATSANATSHTNRITAREKGRPESGEMKQ